MSALIFIHLGPKAPKHLWDNISRTKSQFSSLRVVLVSNNVDTLEIARNRNIEIFAYETSIAAGKIFESMEKSFDLSFRSGFWRYSLERLFALCAAHEHIGEESIVHLESDIIVFDNFPWNALANLESMAWLTFNRNSDVAAIVSSPNLSSTRRFYQHLEKALILDSSLTDMTVLSSIRRNYPNEYETLPSISPKIAQKLQITNHNLLKNFERFGGYFDPAALGMWNLGQDPRNGFGFAKRFKDMPEAAFAPAAVRLTCTKGFNLVDQNQDSVFNLHVHSKNRRILKTRSTKYLSKFLHEGKYNEKSSYFSTSLFIELIIDYKRRGKLIELAGNTPLAKKLEKYETARKLKRFLKEKRNKAS
jgi:hypothetical protein